MLNGRSRGKIGRDLNWAEEIDLKNMEHIVLGKLKCGQEADNLFHFRFKMADDEDFMHDDIEMADSDDDLDEDDDEDDDDGEDMNDEPAAPAPEPVEEDAAIARRRAIQSIMRDNTISDQEKRMRIQNLMSGGRTEVAPPPAPVLPQPEGNSACVHYERNCNIELRAATVCTVVGFVTTNSVLPVIHP